MKYTFPSKALKDMEDLEQLTKKIDPDGKKTLDSSDAEVVTRGGSLANAITSFTAKMPNMAVFTPVDPGDFAQKFCTAKQQMKKTLSQKLDAVHAEFDGGTITAAERDGFLNKVKEAHFMQL